MKEHFKIEARPLALAENIIKGEKYRITLLTSCLARFEYDESGKFEDRPSQMVLRRDFPAVPHTVIRTADGLIINTDCLEIHYNEKPFTPNGLSITLKGSSSGHNAVWHYGDALRDLRGTARTLDMVNGDNVELDHGVVSRGGYSVLDDSKSLLIQPDGWVCPRGEGVKDLYFFGYGLEHMNALQDFYRLCGEAPMLPRFSLGNWWSRYYKYSQQEYLELMDKFKSRNIPLSVAVVDMDWHLVDIDPKYGDGWTGFTWNEELFPDHKALLKELHDRGLHTTLNLHPASGIRGYEKAYQRIAKHMGVDAENEETVQFDPTDPEFLRYYYEDVLDPMEEEGVDFWWIDWQQGPYTKIPNLDSLWVLNHYGYLDSGRDGRRPITFSRYAGPGSHRYPIGFSGDSFITWESLRFQPYFTSNAANVGYGWWSHDIAGHNFGYKDDELTARWTQFGAFSPIMRLHSTSGIFHGKEPWRFKAETEKVMGDTLRLRHRLLPYLYTMNKRSHSDNIPICLPLYYVNGREDWAYEHKNEYYFGSELLVMPITSKRIAGLNMAKETVYLPEGLWYDIFSKRVYRGGRGLQVFRDIDSIPVFAKAGGIVPMTDEQDATVNPSQLRICAYLGADGEFNMYEDDGVSMEFENGKSVNTKMLLDGESFTVCPAEGELSLIPAVRDYTVELVGCKADGIAVYVDGREAAFTVKSEKQGPTVTVEVKGVASASGLTVKFGAENFEPHNETMAAVFDFLNQAELEYELKKKLYETIRRQDNVSLLLPELYAMEPGDDLFAALTELLTAY